VRNFQALAKGASALVDNFVVLSATCAYLSKLCSSWGGSVLSSTTAVRHRYYNWGVREEAVLACETIGRPQTNTKYYLQKSEQKSIHFVLSKLRSSTSWRCGPSWSVFWQINAIHFRLYLAHLPPPEFPELFVKVAAPSIYSSESSENMAPINASGEGRNGQALKEHLEDADGWSWTSS